jgi:hypothetical protein
MVYLALSMEDTRALCTHEWFCIHIIAFWFMYVYSENYKWHIYISVFSYLCTPVCLTGWFTGIEVCVSYKKRLTICHGLLFKLYFVCNSVCKFSVHHLTWCYISLEFSGTVQFIDRITGNIMCNWNHDWFFVFLILAVVLSNLNTIGAMAGKLRKRKYNISWNKEHLLLWSKYILILHYNVVLKRQC